MKIKLAYPFSPEKYNTINAIKTPKNNYSSKKIFFKSRNKNMKNFNLNSNEKLYSFSLDEEYVSKLNYYSPDLNLKDKKKETLYNLNLSPGLPTIFKKYQNIDNKNFEENKKKLMSKINVKKQIFEKNIYNEMEHTRYVGRLENMYKENTLEKKRHEFELKIKKIKSLIISLSSQLSDILTQIENCKLDLEIFKNFKTYSLREQKSPKKYLYRESKSNLSIFSKRNSNIYSENNSFEKGIKTKKGKDIEKKLMKEMIKNRKKSIIEEKKLSTIEKLEILDNKKNNIMIKLESCERDLKEFKEKHNIIKNELLSHYHKLLLEGKDTRKDGLSWIIKSIWNLKSNVIMSFLPKFLDMQSISFLFLYSDKLAEIEKIQKKIEKLNEEIKKREKKSKKIDHLCKIFLKSNNKDKYLKYYNFYNEKKNNSNNKKDIYKNNEIDINNKINYFNYNILDNDNSKNNIPENKKINKENLLIAPKHKDEDKKKEFRRMLSQQIPPFIEKTVKEKKKKRLLSQPDIFSINDIPFSDNIIEKPKTLHSDFNINEDTFKTSLYKPNDSKNSFSFDSVSNKQFNLKLKKILFEPEYTEQFSSNISPQKKLKVKDYEHFINFKIDDYIDQGLLSLFNAHKEMKKKLKYMKSVADKLVRKELDRVGKCFYIEDYEAKYNTKLKIVIGALIGEDNIRNELLKQEKEQKDYFKTIKSIRNYNAFSFKNTFKK